MNHFIIMEKWNENNHVIVKRICRVLDPSFDSYCVEMYVGEPQKLIDRQYMNTEKDAIRIAEKFMNSDRNLLLE